MKALFSFLLMASLASVTAHANDVIDLSAISTSPGDATTIYLNVEDTAAAKLNAALQVQSVDKVTEDGTIETFKILSGIACSVADSVSGSKTTACSLSLDVNQGMVGALPETGDLNLSVSGAAAETLYNALQAQASGEDAEGYTFSKTADGILCQEHKLSHSFDCVITASSQKGIVR